MLFVLSVMVNIFIADFMVYYQLNEFGWDWLVVVGAVEGALFTVGVTGLSVMMVRLRVQGWLYRGSSSAHLTMCFPCKSSHNVLNKLNSWFYQKQHLKLLTPYHIVAEFQSIAEAGIEPLCIQFTLRDLCFKGWRQSGDQNHNKT